jgi:RimJ/RimL family protein N-acetyltransferase
MMLALPGLPVSPLTEPDVEAFVAYRRIPDVARYQSWTADYSIDDARSLVAAQAGRDFPAVGEWMQFGIRSAEGALLGDVAVHRLDSQPDTFELGVTIAPAAQGQGLATRALGAMTSHLFEAHGAHRVYAECDTRNAPMKAVLARIGFRHEGTAVDADWFKGEWTTVETWALLAS